MSASPAKPSVPNAFAELALRCEAAPRAERLLELHIWAAINDVPQDHVDALMVCVRMSLNIECCPNFTSSLDAALSLLSPEHDWRRLTPTSISVYAGSPYNAAAQTRYDGYGATLALQLCAAFFKMRAAIEAKASAIEARRAGTREH